MYASLTALVPILLFAPLALAQDRPTSDTFRFREPAESYLNGLVRESR